MEKDNWIPGQKSMIWMELCSKMRDCGTCTRSQFWKGDSDRRQFLTQQQEFAGRREKRQREGKGQAPPSPGDELERSPRSKGVVWKTRSTISNCIPKQTGHSVRALRCLKCKFSPRETKSELYELLWHATTAAPKHLCADPAFPRFAFICQAKRRCSDSARQHSPAENRCGSTSCVQRFATCSSSPAVCSDHAQGCASPTHRFLVSWSCNLRNTPSVWVFPLTQVSCSGSFLIQARRCASDFFTFLNQNRKVAKHLEIEHLCS